MVYEARSKWAKNNIELCYCQVYLVDKHTMQSSNLFYHAMLLTGTAFCGNVRLCFKVFQIVTKSQDNMEKQDNVQW